MLTDGVNLAYTICFCFAGENVLVLYRTNKPNQHKWNGLGGKIEVGENPRESIIREMKEEAALDLTIAKSLSFSGVVTWSSLDNEGNKRTGGMYCFIADFAPDTVFEDRETREGKLSWKEKKWVLDPTNTAVTDNISYFLPRMLDSSTPREYHCTYQVNKLIACEERDLARTL